MRQAVILHNIDNAQDYIKNKLYQDALLFSTHSSVDTYLREFHNIKCDCISKFLKMDEGINIKIMSSQIVSQLLNCLDSEFTPSINEQCGINEKMKYFVPLYSYLGKYHFSGYVYFVEAIKRIIEIHKLDKIFFYNYQFNSLIDVDSDISHLRTILFADLETSIIGVPNFEKRRSDKSVTFISVIKKFGQMPLWASKIAFNKILNRARFSKFSSNKKTILLYEYLFDLDFIKENLSRYNTVYYEYWSKSPVGFKYDNAANHIDIDFKNFDFVKDEEKNPFVKLFLEDIKCDFTCNISEYVRSIKLLRKINNKFPISLGIWGSSPMSKSKAIIFEYLKSEGIKVLGVQHGSVFGDSFEPWHFDSDFNRCDYFLSYGFTKDDLSRLYPKHKLNFEIKPFGKTKLLKINKFKKKVDILFPLASVYSIFDGAIVRDPPHILTERQILLLDYLNSLKGLDIYLKPPPFSNYNTCTVLPIFKRLKNLKIVNDMMLMDFLNKYDVKMVVMEFPSTPLFECLGTDAEIFLMNNSVLPFEGQALRELKKRVYYSEDTNEMIKEIDLYLKGKLGKKRDQTFYNHYIYKNNAKGNILQFIHSVVNHAQ